VDVSQKVEYIMEADVRLFDPDLLHKEVRSLDDRLSKIQDLSVLELRKNAKSERDPIISDVRVWYSVRNAMRKPEPLALVQPEPVVKVFGELQLPKDNGYRRVL
jgi:hypothetical protein